MAKTVLIVDDERTLLDIFEDVLEEYRETFTVMTAADGLTAVEKLQEKTVSVVVSNLRMPGLDGFELLDYIRGYHPGIPVIIATGYASPEKEQLARKKGAVAYIEKPFMFEDLINAILLGLTTKSDFHGNC